MVTRICPRAGSESSVFVSGLDDLLAAVVTARTDVMAPMHFAAHGLDRQRWIGQEIVRAVHAALGRRFLVLLYSHDQLLLENSVIVFSSARPAARRENACD